MDIIRHFVGEFAFFCYLHWVLSCDLEQQQRDHDSFPSCCFFAVYWSLLALHIGHFSVMHQQAVSSSKGLCWASQLWRQLRKPLWNVWEHQSGRPQTHQTVSTLLPLPSLAPSSSFMVALGVGFFLFRSDQTLDALGFLITDYLGVLFARLFAIYLFPPEGRFCPFHVTSLWLEVPVCPQAFL